MQVSALQIRRSLGRTPYAATREQALNQVAFLLNAKQAAQRLATKAEIDEMVGAKGFHDNGDGNGVNYISDRLHLEDMHPANVFIDPQSGKPICIDCIVKFIKKEE